MLLANVAAKPDMQAKGHSAHAAYLPWIGPDFALGALEATFNMLAQLGQLSLCKTRMEKQGTQKLVHSQMDMMEAAMHL